MFKYYFKDAEEYTPMISSVENANDSKEEQPDLVRLSVIVWRPLFSLAFVFFITFVLYPGMYFLKNKRTILIRCYDRRHISSPISIQRRGLVSSLDNDKFQYR
jgi:hypothetical protein